MRSGTKRELLPNGKYEVWDYLEIDIPPLKIEDVERLRSAVQTALTVEGLLVGAGNSFLIIQRKNVNQNITAADAYTATATNWTLTVRNKITAALNTFLQNKDNWDVFQTI